jgi:hypothetical protein
MGGLGTFPAALVAVLFPNGVNGQDRAAARSQQPGARVIAEEFGIAHVAA